MISKRKHRQILKNAPATRRDGFTVLETVFAFGLLVVVIGVTAQAGYVIMGQRVRTNIRCAALQAASNTLEVARATPWQALTPEWAAGQRLPEDWVREQPDGKLDVRVRPEGSLPGTKRVTVTIVWDFREGIPPQELQLVAEFAARAADKEAP